MKVSVALLVGRESGGEPFSWQLGLLLDVWEAAEELQVRETVYDLPVTLNVITRNASIGKTPGGEP